MDRQHQIKRLTGILFIAVLPLLNPAHGADKNTRQTSPDGDEGYFGGGSPGNTNAMILWPRDDYNIVRKYRPAGSAAPSPLAFKLWVNPGRSGGFPVNLKNAGAFCSFLQNIGKDPDKGACICEDDPGLPYTGAPLSACAGVNFPACNPVACAPGTPEQPEETEDTRPDTRPACRWSTGTWTPSPVTRCEGASFTQRRNVTLVSDADCVGGTKPSSSRTATGTKYCRPSDPPGPRPVTRPACRWTTGTWTPSPATTCSDKRLSQRRSVTKITANCVGGTQPASTRTVPGSKRCSTCVPTSWSPGQNTVCAGTSFTQTRTLKNCSNDSRNARGTKCCGTVTTWSPGSATKCGTFTQTRTNACGKTESRQAKGTASWCGCSWGPYTPSPGTVCKGKTFTQKSYYSCSGRTNKPRTRTATGTKSCQKAECSNGQSYCSAYKRYLCRNGKWNVIAHGPYACFTP